MVILPTINIESLPFNLNEFEATLLFAEYPTTIIFQDEDGFPVIKEWVDCSDDGLIDRFVYFKTTRLALKKFVSSIISHKDFITEALDGLLFLSDESKQHSEYGIIPLRSFPADYFPAESFFFTKKDSVDLHSVDDHFSLNEIELSKQDTFEVKNIASINKTETIYLHLHKGKGVGYGRANTDVVANTLLKFDKLYKESALDYILSSQRGEIQIKAKKNEKYLPITTTEVYANIAASYGILLRPVKTAALDLFGETDAEKITKNILELISKSQDIDELKKEYISHSEHTIKSLREFMDEIYTNDLNIDLSWISPFTQREFNNNIDYKKAEIIKSNIERLAIEDDEEFKRKGKFRMINCDTGSFLFVSNDEEKFYGSFDKLLRGNSYLVNFLDIYEVSIRRNTKKEAGKSSPKITHTIIAYYKEDKPS